MQTALRYFLAICAVLCLAACSPSGELVEGGLYVVPHERAGHYQIIKLLRLDQKGVHLRLYSNVVSGIPDEIDESGLYMAGLDKGENEALGMGHVPISRQGFASWNAVFIQQSSVIDDELEGYELWRDAGGGYF